MPDLIGISGQIWLSVAPVDLRRGIDGLSAQVAQTLEQQPCEGSAFVFRNACGNHIKVLLWDGNSPVPSGLVNERQLSKRCSERPNSMASIRPHGLEIPWNCAYLAYLTAVSTNYCRLHDRLRMVNHRMRMIASW